MQLIQDVIWEKGELFHRSGDEMLVLLSNMNVCDAKEIAENISVAIEQKRFSIIGQGVVTTTIGIATYPDTCNRWEDLVNVADKTAMNANKDKKE